MEFLQAAKYRAREVYQSNGYLNYGYIIVRTDADINLLKNLVYNGYCLTASVDAAGVLYTDLTPSLYDYLNASDVIDTTSLGVGSVNHAQTIVGFKDGTTWNPADPDN